MSTEHADPDRGLGEVFCRMSRLRAGLGEEAYARGVTALLAALGRVALEEAERRAAALEGRRPRPADVRVRPFADRSPPDAWPD